MALEQYFQEAISQNDLEGDHKSCLEKWQSDTASVTSCDDNHCGGFDCNICLDSVQDPVVTLCGHLFCWPCIYKWLHSQSVSADHQYQQQLQCPVCKARVSQATLVPLYGRSPTTKPSKSKAPNVGILIPRRPLGPVCGVDMPRSPSTFSSSRVTQQLHHHQAPHLGSYTSSVLNLSGTSTNIAHPIMGMLEEMVYARVFGNSVSNVYSNTYSLAGSNSPRVRRHVMQADKSLSRICFFFLCCVVSCLVLF